jgi:hypothetical protein
MLYTFSDHRSLLDLLARLEPASGWWTWLSEPGRDRVLGGREMGLPALWRQMLPAEAQPAVGENLRLLEWQPADIAAGGEGRGLAALPVTVLTPPSRPRSTP